MDSSMSHFALEIHAVPMSLRVADADESSILNRLPQPIEHGEANRRQEWVVIVKQRVKAQGVF